MVRAVSNDDKLPSDLEEKNMACERCGRRWLERGRGAGGGRTGDCEDMTVFGERDGGELGRKCQDDGKEG